MVKVKEDPIRDDRGQIDVQRWLFKLGDSKPYLDHTLIHNACVLSQLAGQEQATESGESCLQQGLAIAEILIDLEMDSETLAAALIYDSVHYGELTVDDVREHLGKSVAKLVRGVERMDAISAVRGLGKQHTQQQLDNVRKMLLAMVDDARVVLIKLAERLRVLRMVVLLSDNLKVPIAHEIQQIFAPLANRLGVGSVKWEMEDLAFRCLNPDDYKAIAKSLNERRLDRDTYVGNIVEVLQDALATLGIEHGKVYGRSKHINSIHRKMQRKNVSVSQIYDATAVRVLVQASKDCYRVLDRVHQLWQPIPEEFDDYIANPKNNGYRSLHTAVIGPQSKIFEVQIRTFEMHEAAELGVAAHWKYKEGVTFQKQNHERKIEWLREVLDWHRELAAHQDSSTTIAPLDEEFLDDRVYIFTPSGDVLDLPKGSTPLDFAYHIHSEIGHRCRGAKVDRRIVPLTHQLSTGEQVEVLTGKEARPSRDWMNPHLNYLKSSRAKAKIHHWFKQQDYEKNCEDGQAQCERELKRLNINSDGLDDVVKLLNFKKKDDLFAALGRGDLRFSQILSRLSNQRHMPDEPGKIARSSKSDDGRLASGNLVIEGVGNLLTHMARCCQPVPGDQIIGYITIGRGVSIHRQDCPNVLHASEEQQKRLVSVNWGEQYDAQHKVALVIEAFNRHDLLRDLTSLLSQEKANVFTLNTKIDKSDNTAHITITLEVAGIEALSRLLNKIKQIRNVTQANRVLET